MSRSHVSSPDAAREPLQIRQTPEDRVLLAESYQEVLALSESLRRALINQTPIRNSEAGLTRELVTILRSAISAYVGG